MIIIIFFGTLLDCKVICKFAGNVVKILFEKCGEYFFILKLKDVPKKSSIKKLFNNPSKYLQNP
jgi:hypothetical protein